MKRQCKACPWKRSVKPAQDIPNGYCESKHRALESTIAEPGVLQLGSLRMMACHESSVGSEEPCVGWLSNQMGPGNNLALRFAAMRGQIEPFETVGPQHECLADTYPKARKAKSRGRP
jgi:hypothetical protein